MMEKWVRITWYDVPCQHFHMHSPLHRVANMNVGVYLPFSQTCFSNEDSKFEYVKILAEVRR